MTERYSALFFPRLHIRNIVGLARLALVRQVMLLLMTCLTLLPSLPIADESRTPDQSLLRLGTGGSGGTYLPIGSLISQALSGSTEVNKSSPHYNPDLLVISQRSTGSASNVSDISEGLLEAGLAQADVAHWAYNASGPFEQQQAHRSLRGVATLYLESVHLIVRTDANINSIDDLEGQRVSLDELGSGTRLDILPILLAHGLTQESIKAVYLKPQDAIERLQQNQLDAFFIVAGYPVAAVSKLVSEGKVTVVPITGVHVDKIIETYPYFSVDTIPADTYQNTAAIDTLGVPAQLFVNESLDEKLVYSMTNLLWSPPTLALLKKGHPKGADVQLETALTGMHIPLHAGAKKFYVEQGMLSNDD